jgi:hypothetical protein
MYAPDIKFSRVWPNAIPNLTHGGFLRPQTSFLALSKQEN